MLRLLALLALLAPAPAAARPLILGFNYPVWWEDAYCAPGAEESLRALAKTGAGWFAVTPAWYQSGPLSADLAPTRQTPSDECVRRILRAGKALGLKAAVKPHIGVLDGSLRALIAPSDPKAWFESYGRFLAHYAAIATEEDAKLLVIATELTSMALPCHQRAWESLIAASRKGFAGPLTYAANYYDFPAVPFWGSLDLIGIDAYFPLAGGRDKDLLEASWRAYLPAVRAVSAAHGKPVLFTEVGCASQRGASARPWDWRDRGGPVDLAEQKAYFESFLKVYGGQDFFAGFLQWAWEARPDAGGLKDKSMTVQGKPALKALERFFRDAPVSPVGQSLERAVLDALRRLGPAYWDGVRL